MAGWQACPTAPPADERQLAQRHPWLAPSRNGDNHALSHPSAPGGGAASGRRVTCPKQPDRDAIRTRAPGCVGGSAEVKADGVRSASQTGWFRHRAMFFDHGSTTRPMVSAGQDNPRFSGRPKCGGLAHSASLLKSVLPMHEPRERPAFDLRRRVRPRCLRADPGGGDPAEPRPAKARRRPAAAARHPLNPGRGPWREWLLIRRGPRIRRGRGGRRRASRGRGGGGG